MTPTLITIIVLVVIVVIAGLAFAIYKAGFRATEVEFTTGLLKTKMTRTPPDAENKAEETAQVPSPPTQARQTAADGGVVRKSRISAPADSGADLSQEATGEGSEIDGSTIELK